MIRRRMFRLGVGGLAVAMCLMMAVPAGTQTGKVKISSPTAGEPGYPTCKAPSHVTNKCSIGVSVKGGPPSTEIAIDECNSNAASGDQSACNGTPGKKPGEVDIVETNASGAVKVKDYKVLVSSTTMEGDGYCADGDTCYIVVATLGGTQIGDLVAFTGG